MSVVWFHISSLIPVLMKDVILRFTFTATNFDSIEVQPFLSFLFQAMVIINGFLYVFGGTTGYIYSTDLHRLDLTSREWIHLKPNNPPDDLPEERYSIATHEWATGSKYAGCLFCVLTLLDMACFSCVSQI